MIETNRPLEADRGGGRFLKYRKSYGNNIYIKNFKSR